MHVFSGPPTGSGVPGRRDDRRTAYRSTARGHQRDPPAPEEEKRVERHSAESVPDPDSEPCALAGGAQGLARRDPDRRVVRVGRRRVGRPGRHRCDDGEARGERGQAPDRDPQTAGPRVADHDIEDAGHPPRIEHPTTRRRAHRSTRNGSEHHAPSTRAVLAVRCAKAPDNRSVDRCHESRGAPGGHADRRRSRCGQHCRDRDEKRDCEGDDGHGPRVCRFGETRRPADRSQSRPARWSRERNCRTALAWICEMRLSVTPSASPISASVRPSS